MPDRREMLQLGLAASALPLSAAASTGRPSFDASPIALQTVVYDQRYGEARAFAAEFGRRGVPLSAIAGDVTALWFDELHPRWAAAPAPLAGLTDRGALFCLEILARDAGMRVVFRADHLVDASGEALHRIVGPQPLAQAVEELAPSRAFGQVMAALASRCPAGAPAPAAAQMGSGPFSTASATPLVSWIIAPQVRA